MWINHSDDWSRGDVVMIAVICALLSGVTIVLSRSLNGYLTQKVGEYQSTFYNFFTGTLFSLVFVVLFSIPYFSKINLSSFQPIMLLGGVLGVFNILILNYIVPRISPVALTLISFVSQLMCGMILDYFIYDLFSVTKFIGCFIVIVGLVIYQYSE